MTIYSLKPAFQALLRPCVNYMASIRITANQVTLAACLFSILYGAVLYWCSETTLWLLLPVFLLLRMMLNAIDGMLAREHSMASTKGFVLNEIGDLISDAALYLPFTLLPGINSVIIFTFILLAWLSEIVAILGQVITGQRLNHGPLGKSDRAFLMSVIALWFGLFPLSLASVSLIVFWVINLLLVITIFNRFKKAVTPYEPSHY